MMRVIAAERVAQSERECEEIFRAVIDGYGEGGAVAPQRVRRAGKRTCLVALHVELDEIDADVFGDAVDRGAGDGFRVRTSGAARAACAAASAGGESRVSL